MLCKKCGADMKDNATFCGACGEKVTADALHIGAFAEADFSEQPPRKEKKRNFLWLKIASPLVAVLAAAALLLINIPNWFGANDPQKDYVTRVEEKAFSACVDPLIAVYDGLRLAAANQAAGVTENRAMDATATLEVDGTASFLLKSVLGVDISGLNGLSVQYSAAAKDGASQNVVQLLKNGNAYMTIEELTAADGTQYIRYPQFEEKYLKTTPQITQTANLATLPEGARIKAVLEKYMRLVIANCGEVVQSTETVTLGDVSEALTVLDVELGSEDMKSVLSAVLDAAKVDIELRAVLEGLQVGDAYENMLESLEQLLARAEQTTAATPIVAVRSYVNDGEDVVGRALTIDGHTYSMLTVRNGNAFATELAFDTAISVVGSGTEQNGVMNATYAFSVQGQKLFSLSVTDFHADADADTLTGTLLLTPEDGLWKQIGAPSVVSMLRLGVRVQFEADKVTLAIVSGGKTYFGITVHMTVKDIPAAIVLPQDNAVLDAQNANEYTEWQSAISEQKFKDAFIAAGIPTDIVNTLYDG